MESPEHACFQGMLKKQEMLLFQLLLRENQEMEGVEGSAVKCMKLLLQGLSEGSLDPKSGTCYTVASTEHMSAYSDDYVFLQLVSASYQSSGYWAWIEV